ncbi:flavin monoamine oxidase family protein [Aliamphritea hakodatensis]|uniref:flavin monoamine oxidase family protein n=1 Tax=Aliamphritea hakodatensis TaxID=2895352 RepID=UPI0022FD8497|nr:FAD-dependent oxidoreductase [Aliamphritea hakodatensis]
MIQTDIAIIGGGISGLYLAAELQAAGADFRVFEARERVGGRILCTGEADCLQGYDLGPSWFWPGQPRMAALLRAAGLNAYPQYSRGDLVYEEMPGDVRQLNFSTMEGALRVENGMGSLIRYLSSRSDTHRLTSATALSKVRHLPGEAYCWQLTLNRAGEQQLLKAKAVVLAVSPRVIAKTVQFEPPLAAHALQSLQAIPTWMGRFTKVIAEYETPFWREMNLSGDAISRAGPLQEIHDASLPGASAGALFGFLQQLPRDTESEALQQQVTGQLVRLFGRQAANPLSISFRDWSAQPYTATAEDWAESLSGHPQYGLPDSLKRLSSQGLLFTATEMAHQSGGLLEGALEAADAGLTHLRALGLVN